MMPRVCKSSIAGLATLMATTLAHAEVTLHPLFSDHCVLQRDTPLRVWGTASAGEHVTVTLNSQSKSIDADTAGHWQVKLDPLPAGGPFELVAQGTNRIARKDVMLGEVWVASGQSNMNMLVRPNPPWSPGALNFETEIRDANFPAIRIYDVPTTFAETPADTVGGQWTVCSPGTVGDFSATSYFFARSIHRELGVPVGVIVSAVGATAASAWMSRDVLDHDPIGHQKNAEYDTRVRNYLKQPPATTSNSDKPKDPRKSIGAPFLLFNGMIAPLMPYTIRGAIWYQGEGNSRFAAAYPATMKALIGDWRDRWGQGEFPFYYVQITAHGPRDPEPAESNWAELREAQSKILSVPNTGMAVTIDAGSAETVHPANKQAVGQRLARIALAKTYGKNLVWSGPVYQSMKIEGNQIRLYFYTAGRAMIAAGGTLSGFAISGDDRKFVWADATIDGDTVVVTSPAVSNPVAVRYAWAENPEATLFNIDALPASPFRTDTWSSKSSK